MSDTVHTIIRDDVVVLKNLFTNSSFNKDLLNKEELLILSVLYDSRKCLLFLLQDFNVNFKDQHGRTPLHRAVINPEIVIILLENGADINAKCNDGSTPLFHAVCNKNLESVKILIERGADITIKGYKNNTPLDQAKIMEYREIVQLLRLAE